MQPITFNTMPKEMNTIPYRFMIVGGVGAGKTTLNRALEGKDPQNARKTQMIDYSGWGIDTPGEFIEMGMLRRTLTSTAVDARIIIAVQDATKPNSQFPPNYFLMFSQHIIGVVSKIDAPEANAQHAEKLLRQAGVVDEIFHVSAITGNGIPKLKTFLMSQKY